MSIFFLLALTCCYLLSSPHQVQSFSIGGSRLAASGHNIILSPPSSSKTRLFSTNDTDDKQAEIAALEERLRQLKEEEGQILGCKGGGTALGIFGNLVMHVRNVMNTFSSKCTISTYNLYQITPVFKIFSQLK